jgi:osmotically-inducible protein OsmY
MTLPRQVHLAALAILLTATGFPHVRCIGNAASRVAAGDASITANIQAQFRQHPALEPPNLLHVQTLDHVVYLTGQVDTELERSMAESLALNVAGVKRVVNSINFSYEGR